MAREKPLYAIVRLRSQDDTCALFRLLVESGYVDVSFVHRLEDSIFSTRQVCNVQIQTDPLAAGMNVHRPHPTVPLQHQTIAPLMAAFQSPPVPSVWSASGGLKPTSASLSPLPGMSMPPTNACPLPAHVSPSDLKPLLPAEALRYDLATTSLNAQHASPNEPGVGTIGTWTCMLCGNNILASRNTNMMNHVRRHASQKQFQCVHCPYMHNEVAKVRLHMAHNHNDSLGVPLNKLCAEMRAEWNQLLRECFPLYSARVYSCRTESSQFAANERLSSNEVSGGNLSSSRPADSFFVEQNCMYNESVTASPDGPSSSSDSDCYTLDIETIKQEADCVDEHQPGGRNEGGCEFPTRTEELPDAREVNVSAQLLPSTLFCALCNEQIQQHNIVEHVQVHIETTLGTVESVDSQCISADVAWKLTRQRCFPSLTDLPKLSGSDTAFSSTDISERKRRKM